MSQSISESSGSGTPAVGLVSARVGADGETVVHVSGALTAANRRDLQQLVLAAVEAGARAVVVDLSETGYVDTAALGTLVMLGKRLETHGAEFRLANVNHDLRVVLRLTRLDTVLQLSPPDRPTTTLPPAA